MNYLKEMLLAHKYALKMLWLCLRGAILDGFQDIAYGQTGGRDARYFYRIDADILNHDIGQLPHASSYGIACCSVTIISMALVLFVICAIL